MASGEIMLMVFLYRSGSLLISLISSVVIHLYIRIFKTFFFFFHNDDNFLFSFNYFSVEISWDGNGWIKGNIGQTGFYRVNYDDLNWNILATQLKHNHKVQFYNDGDYDDDDNNDDKVLVIRVVPEFRALSRKRL